VTPPPAVTVVIPTRDRWPLLRRALDSALAQVAVELEVVVVDDGSTDETPARLAELAEPRVRSIRHERSEGVARSRNDGIAAAAGEWVAFLDDDDLWAPGKLRAQLAGAGAAAFAYARAIEVDERLRPLRLMYLADPNGLRERLLRSNVLATPSAVIVRTAALRETGGFDEELSALADWELWIRLSAIGTPAACEEPVAAYRRHGGNMLRAGDDRLEAELEHMRAKHPDTAAGAALGDLWLLRLRAGRDLAAGRRLAAAGGYLRFALARRSPGMLARAVGALTPGWAHERVRASGEATDTPDWLREQQRRA
jgi:glycosyltransferase involved in cell wall biosynthesis